MSPVIKYNEPLLTSNRCKRKDYAAINYFIGPKFQRKRCQHSGIWTLFRICPRGNSEGGGGEKHRNILQRGHKRLVSFAILLLTFRRKDGTHLNSR